MSGSQPGTESVAEDGEPAETMSLKEWVDSLQDSTGIDPDDVDNYAAVWIFDTQDGGQEVASGWAVDGHTVPTMALSVGLTDVADQLDRLAGQIRSQSEQPQQSQTASRGFD